MVRCLTQDAASSAVEPCTAAAARADARRQNYGPADARLSCSRPPQWSTDVRTASGRYGWRPSSSRSEYWTAGSGSQWLAIGTEAARLSQRPPQMEAADARNSIWPLMGIFRATSAEAAWARGVCEKWTVPCWHPAFAARSVLFLHASCIAVSRLRPPGTSQNSAADVGCRAIFVRQPRGHPDTDCWELVACVDWRRFVHVVADAGMQLDQHGELQQLLQGAALQPLPPDMFTLPPLQADGSMAPPAAPRPGASAAAAADMQILVRRQRERALLAWKAMQTLHGGAPTSDAVLSAARDWAHDEYSILIGQLDDAAWLLRQQALAAPQLQQFQQIISLSKNRREEAIGMYLNWQQAMYNAQP